METRGVLHSFQAQREQLRFYMRHIAHKGREKYVAGQGNQNHLQKRCMWAGERMYKTNARILHSGDMVAVRAGGFHESNAGDDHLAPFVVKDTGHNVKKQLNLVATIEA